jgi:hypothetical protein
MLAGSVAPVALSVNRKYQRTDRKYCHRRTLAFEVEDRLAEHARITWADCPPDLDLALAPHSARQK